MLWLLVALLVVSPWVPTVSAQQAGTTSVDMSLPTLPRPVPPGTSEEFNVTVRYRWNNGFSPQPTTIHLEVVDEPAWLNSTFSPAEIQVPTFPEPQGVNTTLVNLNISVAEDAPAFALGNATYLVQAEANQPLQASEAEVPFEVTAGFRGTVGVSLPKGEVVDANGGFVTEVPIRLENQGNGPLLVSIALLRSPAESKIEVPQDIRLGVTDGDRVQTAHLAVRVPWKVSEEGEVTVEIQPTHASRGTPGKTVQASFQLEGDSAVPIPGPGPELVLALAGLALALGRRR